MTKSILIVEDNLDLLSYYKLLITSQGFRIWASVYNGEEAIVRYQGTTERPDIILLDHRLPGISGLETAQQILAYDAGAWIIFSSADRAAGEQALQLGVKCFLCKPFGNDELIRVLLKVKNALER